MVRDFKPPVNVKPLIRFGRWSFLLLGVTYGATRHSYLQRKEDSTRERRMQLKTERDNKIKEEKDKYVKAEMDSLNAIFNPPKST